MNHQEGMEEMAEFSPEMMEERKCPECGGSGMMMKPNDAMMPCPRCASERMRGETHKGMKDTAYKSIMPEMRSRG